MAKGDYRLSDVVLDESIGRSTPDVEHERAVAIFDLVNRQDWEVCERTQLGMHSRAYAAGGVYVKNETHIAGFRDMVLEKLRG